MSNPKDDDDYELPDDVKPIDIKQELKKIEKEEYNIIDDTEDFPDDAIENLVNNDVEGIEIDDSLELHKKTNDTTDIEIDDATKTTKKIENEKDGQIDPDKITAHDSVFNTVKNQKDFSKKLASRTNNKMYCYFIKPVEEVEVSDKKRTLSIKRFVLVTRRPFEQEFYFAQSTLFVRGFEMSVKTGECELVICDWLTDDTPLIFCDYSKADAYKRANDLGDIQFIKSNKEKIKDRLIYFLRKFIMQEEQELKEAYYKIDEYEQQIIRLRKKELNAMLKHTPLKNPLLEGSDDTSTIRVGRNQYYMLVIFSILFFVILLLALLLFSTDVVKFVPQFPTNGTTTLHRWM